MALQFRTRLSLAIAGIVLLTVTAMTLVITVMLIHDVSSGFSRAGRNLAQIAGRNLEPAAGLQDQIEDFARRFMTADEFVRLALVDAEGTVLAGIGPEDARGAGAVTEEMSRFIHAFVQNDGEAAAVKRFGRNAGVAARLETASGQGPHTLFVLYRAETEIRYLWRRLGLVQAVGFAMLLFGAATSVFISRGLSRPIVALVKGAHEFGQGNLNYRLHWKRKDEFDGLAQAFNTMAISLQEYMHELKQETSRRERLESEFRIAEEMQRALLPEKAPEIGGLSLIGWSRPSREVGGDFYDFIELGPGRVGVAIGDAVGKGLSAALLIRQCWSVLRTIAREVHEPAELLYRTNNEFFSRIGQTHRFVTLFFMVIDADKGVVKYASAGHPPPRLVNGRNGQARWLSGKPSFPLGIRNETTFSETEFTLQPEDTIVLYSDGLTDARNQDNQAYGEDNIESLLAAVANRPADGVLQGLRDDLEKHMNGKEPIDDTTVVVARFSH